VHVFITINHIMRTRLQKPKLISRLSGTSTQPRAAVEGHCYLGQEP